MCKAPPPVLLDDETVIATALVTRAKGRWGAAVYNPIYLTDRRLLWREGNALWPFRDLDVPLSAMSEVEPGGGLLRLMQGGPCLRVVLKSGRKPVFIWVEDKEGPERLAKLIREQMTVFDGEAWRPGTELEQDGRFRPVRGFGFLIGIMSLLPLEKLVESSM